VLRLTLGGTVIAYTGDTAWTPAVGEASRQADLLIAEAYSWDKPVPHHLRHADLAEHAHEITARRVVLTHMSADMLARQRQASHQTARDGLAITLSS
jgi:ribonuclease BN (tRNA processing enzyme)